MHSNGEDVMNDIVEAFSVQNLVPFTSMEMIMSFHKGQEEESARALIHTCFDLLYPGFGYVVNQQLLLDYEKTWRHLKELADRLRTTFIKSAQDPLQNQTMPMDNPSAPESNHTIEIVFGLLDRSVPSQFPSAYKNYPDITDDPLENRVNLDKYYSGLSSVNKDTINQYEESDYVTFVSFVMMRHYLMFPFAADDAYIGVLAGGIGQRKLTATVFYQLVEQSGEAAAWKTYEQNHQCLGLEGSEVDRDLQGAVAAVPVIQKLYSKMREEDDFKKLVGCIQIFTEEQVPFAAWCFLVFCEAKGHTLFNTPLMHSTDFSKAFGCSDNAVMNTEKKCTMVTHL